MRNIRRRFIRWFLCQICCRAVIQGHEHKGNIVEYYRFMRRAAICEFSEDNDASLNAFLQECFEESKLEPLDGTD